MLEAPPFDIRRFIFLPTRHARHVEAVPFVNLPESQGSEPDSRGWLLPWRRRRSASTQVLVETTRRIPFVRLAYPSGFIACLGFAHMAQHHWLWGGPARNRSHKQFPRISTSKPPRHPPEHFSKILREKFQLPVNAYGKALPVMSRHCILSPAQHRFSYKPLIFKSV